MEKKVYFHVKKIKPDKLLIISIADKKEGPFYLFKKKDRHVKRHQFLSSFFEQLDTIKISKYKNVCLSLKSSTLKQYYDVDSQRYRFRNSYLGSVKELEDSYSGKIPFFLSFFSFIFILIIFF